MSPVACGTDVEFTVHIQESHSSKPRVQITLLQCRPQSNLETILPPPIPEHLPEDDVLFTTDFVVPRGYLSDIRYLMFIKPEAYFELTTSAARNRINQTISQLNTLLEENTFICIGPGRWGSTKPDLGINVSFADIHNASALVELTGREIGTGPEPSLGTHFFQDLMEAHIYPLAIPLDIESTRFNWDFLSQAPNAIQDFMEVDKQIAGCVHLIDIHAYRPGYHIELIMDDEQGQAIAFLTD